MKIDERAIVSSKAILGAGVEIGPYSIIGDNIKIGENTIIGSHVNIEGWTEIGSNCRIYTGAVVGTAPQDLKYKGDKSYVVIGDNTILREYVTINRPTTPEGTTVIGKNVFLMAYAHVAHDCTIGHDVVIANSVGLSGHVTVGEKAVLGGFVGVHQFVRIGKLAMVGGYTKLVQDVVPFMMVDGQPASVYGINVHGLRRQKIPSDVRNDLKYANTILFRSKLNLSQAVEKIKTEIKHSEEIRNILKFLETPSRQGILTRIRKSENKFPLEQEFTDGMV
ncbi:MAG TPA: acyl-ACP--UDP-N-acetylglucosamine O-acyltransferase [Candidatus Eremiobacteraeota bacterium]|nr:acyl-ACP--UDP-N-acetylglucosamine O-acyltransferase [Candidatus Eremiobacteraeota bacterium]